MDSFTDPFKDLQCKSIDRFLYDGGTLAVKWVNIFADFGRISGHFWLAASLRK